MFFNKYEDNFMSIQLFKCKFCKFYQTNHFFAFFLVSTLAAVAVLTVEAVLTAVVDALTAVADALIGAVDLARGADLTADLLARTLGASTTTAAA